jgi:thiosulfate dehydrogenase [quinone] large subunit
MGYLNAVGAELKKSWWSSIVVVVFTVCRLIFGWDWFKAGWGKLTSEGWLTDGKFNAGGFIKGMVSSLQHAHGPDPLHLNNVLIWFANNIFLNMGGLVDFLVVFLEIFIGIFVFFGFGLVWTLVAALFLNLQYIAAGSANNFGYIVTDIVWLQFYKSASLIGVDGYIRYKRGKDLLGTGGRTRRTAQDKETAVDTGRHGTPAKM